MKKEIKSKVDELREVLKAKKEAPAKEKAEDEELLSTELVEAREEAKGHYDKLLRVMAEFENYKKRIRRELEERSKYANESLILELLPILDDLERTLDHANGSGDFDDKTVISAVSMVRNTLLAALKKFGLEEMPADSVVFDPNLHEAVSCFESPDHEDNAVVSIHRKGYSLSGKMIRPVQVIVAKKPVK